MAAQVAPDLNLATLPLLGDGVLTEINTLRDFDPLRWSPASQCWIASGHAEVFEALSGKLPLSNRHLPERLYRVMPPEELHVRAKNSMHYLSQMIVNVDGAEHARLRKLLVKAFNKKIVEDLRPYVRARVSMLLDRAQSQRELEFHEQVSRQLPGAVILRLLGMSEDYIERLKQWTDGVTNGLASFDPQSNWIDAMEAVVNDMLEVFRREIEIRRAKPSADFITELVQTADGSDRLTVDEMLAALVLIIVAGHDTTANSMTLGVRALASHPSAWAQWAAHPERSLEASIELMRYIAMSTALPRVATTAFEWRGRSIKQYDLVMILMAGGNRDPNVYASPEEIDFARANDMALTFGPGLHHCVGHLLAKLQMSEFFSALTRRFERVEVLEPPQFAPNLVFRGVNALKVRFHPRAG